MVTAGTGSYITQLRLYNQQISCARFKTPGEVVTQLGAMQGQDYTGTLWAMGLRLPNSTETDIEQAVADRSIIRTWPMRGTLHFVAAQDIRWMLELLSPRIIAGSATRYKELELDERAFTRCYNVFEKALSGGKQATRDELFGTLIKSRIPVDKQRGYHILRRAGQDRIICFGSRRGRQETFTLLDEWGPPTKFLTHDEALCELALRYFTGHGPATLQDFVWWSGLKVSDARAGLNMVAPQLAQDGSGGNVYWMPGDMQEVRHDRNAVYLLPGFDEYMLGYKDRRAALDPRYAQKICPGNNGMFASTIVIDGRIVGAWKRTIRKSGIIVTPDFFAPRTKPGNSFYKAVERYCSFFRLK